MAAAPNFQLELEDEWEGKLDLIKRTVASGANRDELEIFLYHAKRAGLDPLARQIYLVKRKGKATIQVGIDGLRLIADRTGLYAGNDDAIFDVDDRGRPQRATVVVYKMVHGSRCAFSATARWDEYFPGEDSGFQWKKMPHVMLAKCAEAQALRKAFPMEMSGLYVHEEMEQASAEAQQGTRAIVSSEPSERTVAPVGQRSALGYTPERWPAPGMFGQPITENQAKMVVAKSRERGIPREDVPFVRTLVLNSYQVGDGNSKGNASLFIDWLMNADEDAIEAALTASANYEGDGTPASVRLEDELDPYADGAA